MNELKEYRIKEKLKKEIDDLILKIQREKGLSNNYVVIMLEEISNLYKN